MRLVLAPIPSVLLSFLRIAFVSMNTTHFGRLIIILVYKRTSHFGRIRIVLICKSTLHFDQFGILFVCSMRCLSFCQGHHDTSFSLIVYPFLVSLLLYSYGLCGIHKFSCDRLVCTDVFFFHGKALVKSAYCNNLRLYTRKHTKEKNPRTLYSFRML